MRIRNRRAAFVALVTVIAALTGAAAPAGAMMDVVLDAPQQPGVAIGIADQKPDMFGDPRFLSMGIKHARLAVGWDVLTNAGSAAELDDWLRRAQAADVQPLISFMHSRGPQRRVLPSPSRLKLEFRRLRELYPWVTTYATWNEANHCGEPLCHRPKTAAAYYKVLRRECPTCTILAPEMLDMPGMGRWVKEFNRTLGFTPRLWGMHNYVEANRFKTIAPARAQAGDAQRRDLADRGRRPRAPQQRQHHGHPRGLAPRRRRDPLHLRRPPAAQPDDPARLHLPLELVVGEGHVGLGAHHPGRPRAQRPLRARARAALRAQAARQLPQEALAVGRWMTSSPWPGGRLLLAWLLLAAAALVALAVWQGEAYWEYSDGVYSLSARQLLDGHALYRDFAGAQPPPLYLLGAGALALSDAPAAIRVLMALCEAATSLLVLVAVWRLTRRPGVALAAALACFVTPWALREHAQLLPETVAAPLLLGATLAAARRGGGGALAAGVLGAIAVSFKVAFALPALAIVLAARERRRALSGFAAAGAVLALTFLLIFGEPLWSNVVAGQAQTGRAALGYVVGLWAQAGWNVAPLLVLAALAWPARAALADADLARSLLAAALGSLLLLATLLKHGSWLTVMVVVEPPLLCLAAGGVAALLGERDASGRAGLGADAGAGRSARAIAGAAAVALLAAQAGSLLAAPDDPVLFTRPLAATAPARALSDAEVTRAVAAIRRCPAGTTYSGAPYLAFVAGRDIAGAQPDQFMIHNAANLERFRRAAENDRRICAGRRRAAGTALSGGRGPGIG